MADYNSSFTGEQIDEAVGDVRANKAIWGEKKNKVLTLAEYEALSAAEKQADILYHIVDDFATSGLYTKAQVDALLAQKQAAITATGILKGTGSSVGVQAVDSTVVAGSSNLVTSGAVKTAIDNAVATLRSTEILVLTTGTISSLPFTYNNSAILSNHVVLKSILSTPTAQEGDWTVTTANGSLTISGALRTSSTTTVTLYLGYIS